MKKVTMAILGAGGRGFGAYAPYALSNPELAQVVAVAEPDPERRQKAVDTYNIPPENVFESWEDFVKKPKMCDAVIIATQDQMHTAPAIACANLKYDILLEKPMATTKDECEAIIEAVERNKVIFAVCFVLRYTYFYRKLKELLDSGVIGKLVTFRHIEQVSYWHQAHSFVRGNWRNSVETSPMILAKCSHDTDIINFLVGTKCNKISSFGSLKFFNRANQPQGAADRCLDCPEAIESKCQYSAKRFYLERTKAKRTGWPVNVLTADLTVEGVTKALREGPYGRCVFACDNDVVDNQVVNFEYDGGVSGSMTMTAFNDPGGRSDELYGTEGQIIAYETGKIVVRRFGENKEICYDSNASTTLADGHGGGDTGISRDFVAAVATRDQSKLGIEPRDMLAGHLMAFAAEESRLTDKVIKL